MLAQEAEINLLSDQGRSLEDEIKEKLAEARRAGAGARENLKQEGAQAEATLLEEVKRQVEVEWATVEKKIKADMAKAREVAADADPELCPTAGHQDSGEGTLMNGGRRTGRLRIPAVFWGLGAGLLLAGVAAASEAAHGGGHGGFPRKRFRISSGAPLISWCSPPS